ncbi:adenosylcobinamide amidohydrolase [Gorillibacterium sp. sgz500922]|uniref:adenosylcobinamide amidohydrolase n=1 Tax=Gorillibacterium sp. sgz500922 TaxID=3446694 RepID=UPI003F678752
MTLPFIDESAGTGLFRSAVWPGLSIRLDGDCLLTEAPEPLDCLSSAVFRGGRNPARLIANWMVHKDYAGHDPEEDCRAMLAARGHNPQEAVALQTAAVLRRASVAEEAGDGFALCVCTTSGTRNAARAGWPRQTFPAYRAGTINTVILLRGAVSESARVGVFLTATEAKAAALQDAGILDPESGRAATGTTTDATVLAVGSGQAGEAAPVHLYAGTATTLGDAVGRLVYSTLREAIEADRRGNAGGPYDALYR